MATAGILPPAFNYLPEAVEQVTNRNFGGFVRTDHLSTESLSRLLVEATDAIENPDGLTADTRESLVASLKLRTKLLTSGSSQPGFELLISAIEESERYFNANVDWETRFDVIFGRHGTAIRPLVEELPISFKWFDPDTTYEEDVRAYMYELSALKEKLQKLLSAPAE